MRSPIGPLEPPPFSISIADYLLSSDDDGYILPEDVSICFINSIHAFRMECTVILDSHDP